MHRLLLFFFFVLHYTADPVGGGAIKKKQRLYHHHEFRYDDESFVVIDSGGESSNTERGPADENVLRASERASDGVDEKNATTADRQRQRQRTCDARGGDGQADDDDDARRRRDDRRGGTASRRPLAGQPPRRGTPPDDEDAAARAQKNERPQNVGAPARRYSASVSPPPFYAKRQTVMNHNDTRTGDIITTRHFSSRPHARARVCTPTNLSRDYFSMW